jgi:CheY-like chemotaxis protein
MVDRRPRHRGHFETIPVAEVLRRVQQQRASARDGKTEAPAPSAPRIDRHAPRGRRVLSISYDVALLTSRQLLLEGRGYEVVSVVGLDAALGACRRAEFDLVILGHSIPPAHKRQMLDQIRAACQAPVLALQRSGESHRIPRDADHTFDPIEGPRAFLETVDAILR